MLLRVSALLLFLLACLPSWSQQRDSVRWKVFYYEGGAKRSEGNLRNGIPDGYWKTYYRNGKLKAAGNRENFKLDSIWTFYNIDGVKTSEISYENEVKQGLTKVYKEGKLYKTEPYQQGKIEGFVKIFFPDSSIQKEIPYVNNKQEGTGYQYADDGRIISLLTYKNNALVRRQDINRVDKQEQKQGLWISFHKNRQIATEGPYVNDLKNGYWKFYKANGDLIRVEKWVMGELQEGATETAKIEIKQELNPKNGKLAFKGAYRDGEPVGVHRFYDDEGKVDSSVIYEDGLILYEGIVDEQGRKQGPWKIYYRSGGLKARGSYKNDLKVGTWKYFLEDGSLEQTGSYISGKPDGLWTWYFPNGELWREEEYVLGLEDGVSIEYNDTGAVIAQGEYISGFKEGKWFFQLNDHREEGKFFEGERTGEWKHFYLDTDNLRFTGFYENGIKNGLFVWFYPDGSVKRRGNYLNNNRDGIWEFFNEQGERIITIEYNEGEEVRYNGEKISYGRRYERAMERERERLQELIEEE